MMGVARPLAKENFAFGELKCLISGPFLVEIHKYLRVVEVACLLA